MTTSFDIESRDPAIALFLNAYDSDYFLARVIHPGLDATARVGCYMSVGLGEFFADLAANWKGWEGARRWESLEGELVLTAQSDRTGHVYLKVHLHDGSPQRWTVELQLTLEAGQLPRLAATAQRFEQSSISAA